MEQYAITPAGKSLLEMMGPLSLMVTVGLLIFLAVLAILMPYFVYQTYKEVNRIRKVAERWEQWMRSQR